MCTEGWMTESGWDSSCLSKTERMKAGVYTLPWGQGLEQADSCERCLGGTVSRTWPLIYCGDCGKAAALAAINNLHRRSLPTDSPFLLKTLRWRNSFVNHVRNLKNRNMNNKLQQSLTWGNRNLGEEETWSALQRLARECVQEEKKGKTIPNGALAKVVNI